MINHQSSFLNYTLCLSAGDTKKISQQDQLMRLALKADKTVNFRIKKYYVGKRGLRKEANPTDQAISLRTCSKDLERTLEIVQRHLIH